MVHLPPRLGNMQCRLPLTHRPVPNRTDRLFQKRPYRRRVADESGLGFPADASLPPYVLAYHPPIPLITSVSTAALGR